MQLCYMTYNFFCQPREIENNLDVDCLAAQCISAVIWSKLGSALEFSPYLWKAVTPPFTSAVNAV